MMDEASIEFSKTFYRIVFSQKSNICEAFRSTMLYIAGHQKQDVRDQLHKFLMIRDIDDFDIITKSDFLTEQLRGIKDTDKGHQCNVLGPFLPGELKDLAIKPQFKRNKARVDNLIGRSEEI